ncbi:MAG: hypothetical protein JWL77_3549 [Chthonomonadaceae bacterium]|nr:hypothetical protein [Chthonomonadaceae bacterium]
MPFGLPDASLVTDRLCRLLGEALRPLTEATPAVPVVVSGDPPDVLRQKDGSYLSVYLFHVVQNTSLRNAPVVGLSAASRQENGGQSPGAVSSLESADSRLPVPGQRRSAARQTLPIPYQPLGLELFYLITAISAGAYAQEQQIFSLALKRLHENPTLLVDAPGREEPERLRVALESESLAEMTQRWQTAGAPIRLSAVYRVGILFLEPPAPPPPSRPVTTWTVSAHASALPQDTSAQVIGTFINVRYTGPEGEQNAYDLSPANAAPGQTLLLHGLNFGGPTATRVYLLDAGGVERDITDTWVQSSESTSSRFVLRVPIDDAPIPGVYQIRVGDSAATRSNATPFQIAALVQAKAGPLLKGNAPQIEGQGFVPAVTELYLDTLRLTETTGNVQKGQFRVVDSSLMRFHPPDDLPPGRYAVRVRVNRVDSPPALWLEVT